MIKKIIKERITVVIKKLPIIKLFFNKITALENEVSCLREFHDIYNNNSCWPVGHFYSSIVLIDSIKNKENVIWKEDSSDNIKSIELSKSVQLDLARKLACFYVENPFEATKKNGLRYYFENDYYSYTDGIVLYSMLRHFRPKRIIEIGSGFSSSLMLDTNEYYFNNSIDLTFIEPYTQRLNSLLKKNDKEKVKIIEMNVQEVPLKFFEELNSGDILFVDSSHVVKTGSDVNFIVFEILPILKQGVLIHFHDVFYPFEYPKEWVYEGRNWNEDYLLRAFLMYNSAFEIVFFSRYLHRFHKEVFESMPACYKNQGGNLWLKKK